MSPKTRTTDLAPNFQKILKTQKNWFAPTFKFQFVQYHDSSSSHPLPKFAQQLARISIINHKNVWVRNFFFIYFYREIPRSRPIGKGRSFLLCLFVLRHLINKFKEVEVVTNFGALSEKSIINVWYVVLVLHLLEVTTPD